MHANHTELNLPARALTPGPQPSPQPSAPTEHQRSPAERDSMSYTLLRLLRPR